MVLALRSQRGLMQGILVEKGNSAIQILRSTNQRNIFECPSGKVNMYRDNQKEITALLQTRRRKENKIILFIIEWKFYNIYIIIFPKIFHIITFFKIFNFYFIIKLINIY